MKIVDFSAESLVLVLISGSRWVLKLEQLFPLKVRKAEKRAGGISVPAESTAKSGGRAGTAAREALQPNAAAFPDAVPLAPPLSPGLFHGHPQSPRPAFPKDPRLPSLAGRKHPGWWEMLGCLEQRMENSPKESNGLSLVSDNK